jgi:outer membrane protein TolC
MSKHARYMGLLLGIIAVAGALAPAAPQPPDPNKALAQEQLKLARQALRDLDSLYQRGEAAFADSHFVLWERRQAEAIRASGAPQAEVVAALEAYVKRLKGMVPRVQLAYEKGGGTHVDVLDAQYRVLEAEMWLNQEKSR